MGTTPVSEDKRVRYLLGLASLAEREHVESEYFDDEDAFQEMLTTEDDLIDAYVRGELAGEEGRRFEKSFVSTLHGRDRVQFARAFAKAVSETGLSQKKSPTVSPSILETIRSPGLLRSATIAMLIVFTVALAWLIVDRRRMSDELHELRADSAALGKRTEELERSSNAERTRTAQVVTQLADLQAYRGKPGHRERAAIVTKHVRHWADVKRDGEKTASSEPEPAEKVGNVQNAVLGKDPNKNISDKPEPADKIVIIEDSSLGSTLVNKQITQLPLEARNVPNLLTLQPAPTRDGFVTGTRADQTNVTLDRVSVETLSTFFFTSRNTRKGATTIRIPNSFTSIRLQLALDRAAIHEDYRITIKTEDGRSLTSVDWIQSLTPNQTIINTPIISISNLPSANYVFLLTGKERDGSFTKVAEYSFKMIRY